VDDEIAPAELLRGAIDPAPGADSRREVAVGASGGDDRPAVVLEPGCDRGTDPAGSAGDEGALVSLP
jgi:hypothetical protein